MGDFVTNEMKKAKAEDAKVLLPDAEELSAIGPAYAAGLSLGMWNKSIFEKLKYICYEPHMEKNIREKKYSGWKKAVDSVKTN